MGDMFLIIKSGVFIEIKKYHIITEKSVIMRYWWHLQRESNARFALRRGMLYPLNYGGGLMLCNLINSVAEKSVSC